MNAAKPAGSALEQHAAWTGKRVPAVEQVRPGLWSVPTVIPDNPLRYVIAYVVELDDGIALIDTGWVDYRSWESLQAGIAATGHSAADVRYILLTHSHIDHHGLSARVKAASGAQIGMHTDEYAALRDIRVSSRHDDAKGWLTARGADQDFLTGLAGRHAFADAQDSLIAPDFFIPDGSHPLPGRPDITAIWTPGHTQGHLCFHFESDRVLVSGDHVLPRITPHISRAPMFDDDAVGSYLGSLAAIGKVDVDEVLPAHEYRFVDLSARVADLLDHHRVRLDEIEGAVANGAQSTWDVAQVISWSRGWNGTQGMMRHTAVSETYTHLRHLERTGRLQRTPSGVDSWMPRD
ncbi:MBL fold metallo-hydrolase [Mycetocola zhadangensis]|uniref:MBL fold metallo-hydrolase n=1 Tax=Mycetocola zhadangensis TaxID=1164595 RepID=UPI003A4D2E3A